MHKILTLNNISAEGLDRLPSDRYEVGGDIAAPDGVGDFDRRPSRLQEVT